jgi:hypothetical protein
LVLVVVSVFALVACGSTPRTATNFCRQLEKEISGMTEAPVTPSAINELVERYERLLEVAPLAVEDDWRALTEMLRKTADVDAADEESIQAVVDEAYATERSAQDAQQWVVTTCGIDISSGAAVTPTATTEP